MTITGKNYTLITGGTGYIGSHTIIKLINSGYENIVVLDNLVNSQIETIDRIKQIVNKRVIFHQIDICDYDSVLKFFIEFHQTGNSINSIIHFAGLKSVMESCKNPLDYYDNNFVSTLNLLKIIDNKEYAFPIKNFIFSSSATIYGDVNNEPLKEIDQLNSFPTSPYGRSKLFVEHLIKDYSESCNKNVKFGILRYFNPIGAHSSGLIGEDPQNESSNLLPKLSSLAINMIKNDESHTNFKIFGNDYNTRDGTAIRDYIHVEDLANGHLKTLEFLDTQNHDTSLYKEWNLGSGKGFTVLEILAVFEKTIGFPIKYEIVDRRPGDVSSLLADCSKAKEELNWQVELNLEDACQDLWNWLKNYHDI